MKSFSEDSHQSPLTGVLGACFSATRDLWLPKAQTQRGGSTGSWSPFCVHGPHFVFMIHISYSWSTFLCSWSTFWAHDPHFVPMIHILCSWFGEHQPRSGLLQKTPLTEDQFLVVKTGLEPEAAASEYQVRYVFFRHWSYFSWLQNHVKVSLVSGHILS